MTVDSSRTIDNSTDVNRKIPSSAIEPGALNNAPIIEKITGPGSGATVLLSQPAESISLIQSYTTATGIAPAINPQYPLEGTDWSAVLKGASGVAEITEGAATARVVETWVVHYIPKAVDPDQGGQSSVTT